MTDTLAGILHGRGDRATTWPWSVDPEGWRPAAQADDIAAAGAALPGDVILLPDAIEGAPSSVARDRSETVQALPRPIDAIRERGRHLVTLPG